MKKPIIGLTTALTQAKWGAWDTEATVVDSRYIEAVTEAGASPILLPPHDGDIGALLDHLDGLLLIGGADINPSLYSHKPHPQTEPAPRHLDEWNLALIRAAVGQGLPLLGLCRGMQLFNVAFGGTLHQHVPDLVGHNQHRPARGVRGRHAVRIAEGSVLGQVLGPKADVVTYHHQAIDRLGEGLTAIAWSDDDIIEAVVLAGHPFAIGVQWHPEQGNAPRLMQTFVNACRQVAPIPLAA